MLVATNLKKDYVLKYKKTFLKSEKQIKKAVSGVDIRINKGEIVGLLGVNGAGKTTTIKMLTTMISPSSGSIFIDDIDAVHNNMEAKKKINLITGGERNIYWRLTAYENLEYFGSLYGIPLKILSKRIDRVLKIVDLYNERDIPVEKYSKGMKQRLQIARGLINEPEYLFMDEPTLGLDIMITQNIHQYIKKLAVEENKGILITTHYIFEAEELCDYIYVINDGKIVAEGKPGEIRKMYTKKKNYEISLDYIDDHRKQLIFERFEKGLNCMIVIDDSKVMVKSDKISLQDVMAEFIELNMYIKNIDIKEASLEDALFEIIKGEKNEICESMFRRDEETAS